MIRLLFNILFGWLDRRLSRLKSEAPEPIEQLPPGRPDAAPRPPAPQVPAEPKKGVLFPGLDDRLKSVMKGRR